MELLPNIIDVLNVYLNNIYFINIRKLLFINYLIIDCKLKPYISLLGNGHLYVSIKFNDYVYTFVNILQKKKMKLIFTISIQLYYNIVYSKNIVSILLYRNKYFLL